MTDDAEKYEIKPKRDRWVVLAAIVILLIVVVAFYLGRRDALQGEQDAKSETGQVADRAETAEDFAAQVAETCATEGPRGALHRQGLCGKAQDITDKATDEPIDQLDPDDPDPNDPDPDDPDPDNPERQNPEIQDREIQDREIQQPETDDPPASDGQDGADSTVPGPKGDKGDPGEPGQNGAAATCGGEFVCADELAAILADYAPRSWVIDLLQALGCELTGIGSELLTCTITGKP